MNNSRFLIETVPLVLEENVLDKKYFREREAQLSRLIEAVQEIHQSKAWSSLKTELFAGLTERLSKELVTEAKKEVPDTLKLSRLAGQLKWAERYSDLSKLEQEFKAELLLVKTKLHGTTEKAG